MLFDTQIMCYADEAVEIGTVVEVITTPTSTTLPHVQKAGGVLASSKTGIVLGVAMESAPAYSSSDPEASRITVRLSSAGTVSALVEAVTEGMIDKVAPGSFLYLSDGANSSFGHLTNYLGITGYDPVAVCLGYASEDGGVERVEVMIVRTGLAI
jgi:hypothetical protein